MNDPRRTILVVDDEPEVLRSIHDLLRLSYRVVTCQRGPEALNILAADGEVDVLLSDQRMPGMSGVELLRQAHRIRPDTTRLLFTAYADIKAVIDAINQGHIFRYISKPWDPDELEAVIRQAVEHHELIAERSRLLHELRETNARLVEANRLKEAFLQVASHELNTPVAVVLGMTELWTMAQGPTASPAERAWVERIRGAARRLAATVERMLKFIQANEFDRALDIQTVALEPLIRESVALLEPFLETRRQTLALDLDPELGSAEVDPAKLGDILANLLINAIKFTPDGGAIRLAAGPAGPHHVRFQVTDEGVGIGPLDQRYLFHPFFTGFDTFHHSSGEYQFGKRGMGLGLCLVKAFVTMHGGEVEVLSHPGQGTTFRFTLPRRRSAASPAATPCAS
jgi:signal transduction histidine kinase